MKHLRRIGLHTYFMQTQIASRTRSVLWTVIAASFGFVIVQLDVTIVNVALPEIGRKLSTGVAGLQWIVDAYTLSFAVLLISAGVLGDRFGSRRAYIQGFFVFLGASLACGLATNAALLIAARTVQGIGAALLVPSSLAVLNEASGHDNALRARMVALWTAAGGVSIAAGPIFGGVLLNTIGWSSIFLVNLPIGALGIALTLYYVPRDAETHSNRTLDIPGQLLAILALTGLTAGLIESGHLGFFDPLVLISLAIAVVSAFLFVRVERRASDPMLPLSFFSLPNFSPAEIFGVLVNLTYYGVVFVESLSPAGARLLGTANRHRLSTSDSNVYRLQRHQRCSVIALRPTTAHDYRLCDRHGRLLSSVRSRIIHVISANAGSIHLDPVRHGPRCPCDDLCDPRQRGSQSGWHSFRRLEHRAPGWRRNGCGAVRCAGRQWPSYDHPRTP